MNKLNFHIKEFNQLSIDELYDILQLRSQIFIVEQDCVYQDIDSKDKKALHILGYKKNKIIAYARVFKPNDYFEFASIGRVVVLKEERKNKYGYQLMETAIMTINVHFKSYIVAISAQEYLEKFYNNLGFYKKGNSYLEDGIPHIFMIRN